MPWQNRAECIPFPDLQTTFWETVLLVTLKRQDFVQILFLTVPKYGLDPVPELDPNHLNLSNGRTESAINRYGSMTLPVSANI